jgi:hypothetical protein
MPAFNPSTAVPVVPWRHAPSAQTVSYHQPAAVGFVDLFSPTQRFIATVTTAQAAANNVPVPEQPEPPAPVADLADEIAARIAADAALNAALASKISDAPNDGSTYVRRNGAWAKTEHLLATGCSDPAGALSWSVAGIFNSPQFVNRIRLDQQLDSGGDITLTQPEDVATLATNSSSSFSGNIYLAGLSQLSEFSYEYAGGFVQVISGIETLPLLTVLAITSTSLPLGSPSVDGYLIDLAAGVAAFPRGGTADFSGSGAPTAASAAARAAGWTLITD